MHEPIDAEAELAEVRAQMANANANVYPPGVVAEIDALRASVHEQARERGIDPTSPEFERMWLVAGAVIGQLLASAQTTRMLCGIDNDVHRGAMGSLLFWNCGITAYPERESKLGKGG